LLIEVLHCGKREVRDFFCYCDLDLDPMSFVYELDPKGVPEDQKSTLYFKVFLKLSYYRQAETDRQPTAIETITTLLTRE